MPKLVLTVIRRQPDKRVTALPSCSLGVAALVTAAAPSRAQAGDAAEGS